MSCHLRNTWQTSLLAAPNIPRGYIEVTCLPEDKNQCQRFSIWDVFKAEWQWKGRGGSRALQLILRLSWPLMASSCKCLLIPLTAEEVLENLMLLILAEELECKPWPRQGATGNRKQSPK